MLDPAKCNITELHRILGANPQSDGHVTFCVWSASTDQVLLWIEDASEPIKMTRSVDGFHRVTTDQAAAGTRYQLQFDQGQRRPDPASRFQPDGVHSFSEVPTNNYKWTDQQWRGAPAEELIIYELHVGTFTDAGTYRAAIDRLDELVDLGITAIELMPLADCAGRWNWGYDGVCLFAPNRNYGCPDDLRSLVDAAHDKGLAIVLDVVYNHLGPEGNYLGEIGPYLSSKHQTAWGSAPNFDDASHGDSVRRFFIANAIYWLDEFHFDGLRVDAIHCMVDERDPHIAIEMADSVKQWREKTDRPAVLIAESNVYDEDMTVPITDGGVGFDAQWGDCFLHSLFATLRPGEKLCDRTYQPNVDLDQSLRTGFVYGGGLRRYRERYCGDKTVDTSRSIYSIQNHDFIGNHPLGKRLHQLASPESQRAAAALLLLSPSLPMIFMGEEFACDQPFSFFVDFEDAGLRQSVVDGRRQEYPQHDWSTGSSPIEPASFLQSKIGPSSNGDQQMLDWYRKLIILRKEMIRQGSLSRDQLNISSIVDKGLFVLRYRTIDKTTMIAVRLNSDEAARGIAPDQWMTDDECSNAEIAIDSLDTTSIQDPLQPNHARIIEVTRN